MICATHDPSCYGCSLRAKTVGYTADATPVMRSRRPWRPKVNCSWEAGIAGEHRPDGSFAPLTDLKGTPIGVKEYGERRHAIDAEVRRLRTSP